jgi:hypothetical protein
MSYSNYTLFDLYEVAANNKIKIASTFSKTSLISTIEDARISLQPKETKDEMDWFLSNLRNSTIICIAFDDEEFFICEDDVIMTADNNKLCIQCICDNTVLLKNTDTEDNIELQIQDFINIFDDEKTIYYYSSYVDYRF